MPETYADPLWMPGLGRRTNFPVVPVKDIPAPELSGEDAVFRPLILIVDADSSIADSLTEILNRSGYAAMAVYDQASALETALLAPPELAIVGVGVWGASEIALAIALRDKLPDCKILLLTERSSRSALLDSEYAAGCKFDLLDRPVNPKELLAFIAAAFSTRSPVGDGSTS
jgi:DNA-binding response OmpR family regulator